MYNATTVELAAYIATCI